MSSPSTWEVGEAVAASLIVKAIGHEHQAVSDLYALLVEAGRHEVVTEPYRSDGAR